MLQAGLMFAVHHELGSGKTVDILLPNIGEKIIISKPAGGLSGRAVVCVAPGAACPATKLLIGRYCRCSREPARGAGYYALVGERTTGTTAPRTEVIIGTRYRGSRDRRALQAR